MASVSPRAARLCAQAELQRIEGPQRMTMQQRECMGLHVGRERHDVERRNQRVDLGERPPARRGMQRSLTHQPLDRRAALDAREKSYDARRADAEQAPTPFRERRLLHYQWQKRGAVPELHAESAFVAIGTERRERVAAAADRRTEIVERHRRARCRDEHTAPDEIVTTAGRGPFVPL